MTTTPSEKDLAEKDILLSIQQLAEYGKQKGTPRFVREAAGIWAVEHSGLNNALAEIDRLRATSPAVEGDVVERAAKAAYEKFLENYKDVTRGRIAPWEELDAETEEEWRDFVRSILSAAGLLKGAEAEKCTCGAGGVKYNVDPQYRCQCKGAEGSVQHASDCAVHNEPAMPNGECTCGAVITLPSADYEALLAALENQGADNPGLRKLLREKTVFDKGSGDAGKMREALQEAALELKALGSCTVLARVEAALALPAPVPADESGYRKAIRELRLTLSSIFDVARAPLGDDTYIKRLRGIEKEAERRLKLTPLPEASAPAHEASDKIGSWLSAALDDPTVCEEMKRDIQAWFDAGQPLHAPIVEREAARLFKIGAQLAISILTRLEANYQTDRDKVADSDLDNEQPITISFRGQLGDIRNARTADACLRRAITLLPPAHRAGAGQLDRAPDGVEAMRKKILASTPQEPKFHLREEGYATGWVEGIAAYRRMIRALPLSPQAAGEEKR